MCSGRNRTQHVTVQYSNYGRGSQTLALASEPRAHEGARMLKAHVRHMRKCAVLETVTLRDKLPFSEVQGTAGLGGV